MMEKRIWLGLSLALFLFAGCAGPFVKADRVKGVYHRVKKGESLRSIAQAYQVSIQDLAEKNDIADPGVLEADRVLFIPDAEEVIDDGIAAAAAGKDAAAKASPAAGKPDAERSVKTPSKGESTRSRVVVGDKVSILTSVREAEKARTGAAARDTGGTARAAPREEPGTPSKTSPRAEPKEKAEIREKTEAKPRPRTEEAVSDEVRFDRKRFVWPVKGQVVSRFGYQPNGMYYNGIGIAAKEGTAIVAAAAGTVTYSDILKDYNETIIIRHDDHYWTVYTNLGTRLGKAGDQVKQGDRIAVAGKNEKGESFVNFEIRYKSKARNPLFFLP